MFSIIGSIVDNLLDLPKKCYVIDIRDLLINNVIINIAIIVTIASLCQREREKLPHRITELACDDLRFYIRYANSVNMHSIQYVVFSNCYATFSSRTSTLQNAVNIFS